ncbi:VHS and GAT domain containing protein [Musa troglodytarum]|uniref:VHS and GAT domain containing protein n=2 Tax=Musa troglodytarum TaxID=320322 RepID=A0A9E7FWH0_9LILI|nr:VHS and GAT domain containing protein [Musa troglodytarum]
MMSFSSSSSSSSATVRVEKATSHLLIGPDWTMNIDICDNINNDQWQAKEVLKAVKKRLQNKNSKVQFLALTLLETIIKNCGEYVHFQVSECKILQEMVKIVRKKTDMQVRDKILVLLDSWQEAFGGPGGKYPQYYYAYIELKRHGIVFPQRPANTPPILTPPVAHLALTSGHGQVEYGVPSITSTRLDETMATDIGNLSLSDFSHIRDVMGLLKEMLQAVNPYDRGAIKDELIVDLVNQCRSNQKKLMQLVSSTGDEKLLGEALELNDDLQSLLAKHEAIASGSPLLHEQPKSLSQATEPIEHPVASSRVEDEDDDEFAQLARRNSKFKQATSVNSSDLLSPNQSDVTRVTESSASSSGVSYALVPLDPPPPPVETQKEPEQDMIDLLSITLSTYPSSPQTPVTPAAASSQQGYAPHDSYVAPWAQRALPAPQPSPSWAATDANPSTFSSAASSAASTHAANLPAYSPTPLRQYNSFGSRINGTTAASVAARETPVNSIPRQSGTTTSPKPYVLPNRLFEDLIDLRSSSSGQKTNARSPLSGAASNQPMIGGKK